MRRHLLEERLTQPPYNQRQMKKLRVAVLYGGRSGEHEVSLQSAASVINYLDRDRFEIVPVAIDKEGRWHLNNISLLEGKKSLPVFKDAPKMRVAKLKRFMARPTFDEELELHRVDCQSSHRMLDNYEFLQRKREEFAHEPIIPPPLVRGEDLMALGLKPGPKFGEILEAVETRQLEGSLRTRQAALEWVRREYAPNN